MSTSCEVRKPSKKWRKGTRGLERRRLGDQGEVVGLLHELEQSRAKPVGRTAMTSLWSPKMESAWVASDRAATCKTARVSSPAILYMFGIISSRPCEAVNVVARAPACKAPWTAPAAPAFALHLDDLGYVAPDVRSPLADHWSAQLAHGRGRRDGVDGDHLVDPVGDARRGLVAVDGRRLLVGHGYSLPLGSGTISMAWHGHCSKQIAHPVHRSKSIS